MPATITNLQRAQAEQASRVEAARRNRRPGGSDWLLIQETAQLRAIEAQLSDAERKGH